MPVLRELVARLGMDYDGRGFAQADKSIGGLTKGLGTMAIAAAGVAAAMGTIKLVGMASDAQETLNVLNTSFGENSEAVQKWAAQFANDAGRSEYAMREMAGTLGAVLNPLMKGNKAAAAEMSTGLSALAVDLGSFFNATDEEALRALKSGIIGQIEPMQKFGIVMTQAELQAFALEKGIRKDIKAMDSAEKTALRYEFILAKTVDAQGDAAKTALGWANATKGLQGGLQDLGTNIGLVMLPAAERVLLWVSDLVKGFSSLVKNTNIVQAAMIVLGTIAAALAIKMLVAFAPVIIKFALIAAAIAAAALVVEDFISFLQGKKSVIGEFINLIAGPGSAEQAANYLKMAWEGMALYAKEELFPAIQNLGSVFSWAKDSIVESATSIWQSISEYIKPAIDLIKELAGWLSKIGAAGAEFLGIDTEKLKKDFKDMMPTGADIATTALVGLPGLAIKKGLEFAGATSGEYGSSLVGAEEAGARQFRRENEAAAKVAGAMTPQQKKQFGKLSGEQQERIFTKLGSKEPATQQKTITKYGGKELTSQQINQEIKIELKTERKIDRSEAQRLANEVQKKVGKENKAVMKALTQRAE